MATFLVFAAALAAVGSVSAAEAPSAAVKSKPHPARFDPYKNFRFRLVVGGRCVAGFQIAHVPQVRHGPRTSPGYDKFEPITLERGLTQDSNFAKWATGGATHYARAAAPAGFRREVSIQVVNEAGRPAGGYRLHRAWASEYQAIPDLDGNANAVAISHIKLENEGWERDTGAAGPPAC